MSDKAIPVNSSNLFFCHDIKITGKTENSFSLFYIFFIHSGYRCPAFKIFGL